MSGRRYIVLTLDDARAILAALERGKVERGDANLTRIFERFRQEEGADMEDLVRQLVDSEICSACSIERQQASCVALSTQKQGRRLRRLLERARGER